MAALDFPMGFSAAILVLALLASACAPVPASTPPVVRNYSTQVMGGLFQIRLLEESNDGAPADPAKAAEAAFEEARRIEHLLNLWSPDSTLARWNAESRTAPAGPLPIDTELAALLARALDFAAETKGAFDPTVGGALRELGFYGAPVSATLDEPTRQRWAPHVGYALLSVTSRASVERPTTGIELDLSALAKGYAADRMAMILRDSGIRSAIVSASTSSVLAFGPGPTGQGWPLEVPNPTGPETWWLVDEAASTSGQSSITLPGTEAKSHILDPRTLTPVAHFTEMVLVRTPTATAGDMLSTALLVLGEPAARAWLNQHDFPPAAARFYTW